MNSKTSLILLFFSIFLHVSNGEGLFCSYREFGSQYSCDLTIQNPNGLNNFTEIRGEHLPGRGNEDVLRTAVLRTSGSISTNVPSIICDTFPNAERIQLLLIGIERINEDSFRNCRNLWHLGLGGNRIFEIEEGSFSQNLRLDNLHLDGNRLTNLPENIFVNQQNLTTLFLLRNNFTNFPRNFFNPMQRLNNLRLEFNQLKIVHSDWFGNLPNINFVSFEENQINAVDERFIDNTGVQHLDIRRNLCASNNIFDTSPSRSHMRAVLQTCFENFENMDGCFPGNLNERVCRLEQENQQQQKQIDDLQEAVQELLNRNCTCTEP